jgi:ribosome assembly protein 4
VYQIAFAPDSRLLVSASKDSTLKVSVCGPGDNNCVQVWNLSTLDVRAQTTAPAVDLPGHGDEVFAVDWAPDAQRVASGAKDKLLRIWRR